MISKFGNEIKKCIQYFRIREEDLTLKPRLHVRDSGVENCNSCKEREKTDVRVVQKW